MAGKIIAIAIAAGFAALSLTVAHLLSVWGDNGLRRLSKPPTSYMAGVTILSIPYVALLWWWKDGWAITAWVAVVIAGGLPVIAGHIAKWVRTILNENRIFREELRGERRNR